MLQLKGEKMSKSLGNLVTIDEFLAEHDADVLRLIIAGSGYRKPLVFNPDVIADSERGLDRLRGALRPATGDVEEVPAADTLAGEAGQAESRFDEAMADDFNTAGALGALFDFVRAINTARQAGVSGKVLAPAQNRFRHLAGVLGLRLEEQKTEGGSAGPFIDLLVETRRDLRQAKQWALADKLRDRLKELGVVVEDTPQGSTWRQE